MAFLVGSFPIFKRSTDDVPTESSRFCRLLRCTWTGSLPLASLAPVEPRNRCRARTAAGPAVALQDTVAGNLFHPTWNGFLRQCTMLYFSLPLTTSLSLSVKSLCRTVPRRDFSVRFEVVVTLLRAAPSRARDRPIALHKTLAFLNHMQ